MADIPTMSLKVAPMQFAAFTPMQYTPQTADPTLLSRSMAAQEARQEKANQYLLAIDTTLAEKRKSLNKADYDWAVHQHTIQVDNLVEKRQLITDKYNKFIKVKK